MASKRTSQEGGQGSDEDRDFQVSSKRRQNNPETENAETRHLSLITTVANDIALYLEPVFRKVVQEAIPPILQHYLTPGCGLTPSQLASTSGGRRLQLNFINKLPQTIFTQSIIKAEGGEPLQIELHDAANQQRIVRDEGYSPMKIRICVLDGEFGSNGEEDWTAGEFNAQIVTPRVGKGPLLNGDTTITLKNGIGCINKKIVFTDISRTRSKTFRLGLKIEQPNSIAVDIREGRSEPFRVMDQRGKAYMKHERPSLNDEVWHLRGIHKGGKLHEQLTKHGIETVKDLLQLYITNQASLRKKLGKTVGKSWNTIIAHAKDCDVDEDERYIYHTTQQSISLVFNCIYDVLEVIFDGQICRSISSLNSGEKRLVERVKQQAYNNLKDLKPLDITTHGLGNTSTGVQTAQYFDPDQGLQQFDFPIAQQGQPEMWQSSLTLGEMLPHCFVGEQLVSGSGAYTYDGVSQIDPLANDLFPNLWEQVNVNPLSPSYGDGAECSNHFSFLNSNVCISRNGKCKTVWHKIRHAFKCVVLYVAKKKEAAKKKAQLFAHRY